MAAILVGSMALVGCSAEAEEAADSTEIVSTVAGTTINLSDYEGEVEITEAGTYTIAGTLEDGQLKISVGEDETVALIFDDASITNSEDHAIKVKSGNLVIESGSATLTASQDGINANQSITIDGGTLTINAGDDGIHADETLTINDGTVNVEQSYEGLEGTEVIINGGDIDVVSEDDGINASDGTTDSEEEAQTSTADQAQAQQGAPGEMQMGNQGGAMMGGEDPMSNYSENCLVQINGGTVTIDATADGTDSNGNVEITGGVVIVNGPASDGEGAFDYDGTATISGGVVLMVGSSGMYQDFSSGSQAWANLSASGSAGDVIELLDANGNVIASVTTTKAYGAILASYDGLVEGTTVTVTVNGTVVTAEATTTSAAGGMGGMMGGAMGESGGMPGGAMGDSSGMPGGEMGDMSNGQPGGQAPSNKQG